MPLLPKVSTFSAEFAGHPPNPAKKHQIFRVAGLGQCGKVNLPQGKGGDQQVRIWDVSPAVLCRQHLLGEHRELHAVWTIITEGKLGYSRHPEVLRWHGRLRALYLRHEELVAEMLARGYRHHSALDPLLASGTGQQDCLIDDIPTQIEILRGKKCGCAV